MPSAPTSAVASGSEPFRLPRTVEPETYRIEIEPDVASATFSGTVGIDLVVHETSAEIVLNAAELAISDVEVLTADGSSVACSVSFNDVLEQVTFRPPEPLPPAATPSAAGSAARSTTSCAAFTGPPTPASTASPRPWPRPSSSRWTRAAPFLVSTSRTARRSSRLPSSSNRTSRPSRTHRSSGWTRSGTNGASASRPP